MARGDRAFPVICFPSPRAITCFGGLYALAIEQAVIRPTEPE